MEDVRCGGEEDSLWKCPHTARHNCDHSEDVAVTCYSIPATPSEYPPSPVSTRHAQ